MGSASVVYAVNPVLTHQDWEALLMAVRRIGIPKVPTLTIEDANLVTVSLDGWNFCLSREPGGELLTFKSLRGTRTEYRNTLGFRVSAYADGDEISNEWHPSLAQAFGSMFRQLASYVMEAAEREVWMRHDAKDSQDA